MDSARRVKLDIKEESGAKTETDAPALLPPCRVPSRCCLPSPASSQQSHLTPTRFKFWKDLAATFFPTLLRSRDPTPQQCEDSLNAPTNAMDSPQEHDTKTGFFSPQYEDDVKGISAFVAALRLNSTPPVEDCGMMSASSHRCDVKSILKNPPMRRVNFEETIAAAQAPTLCNTTEASLIKVFQDGKGEIDEAVHRLCSDLVKTQQCDSARRALELAQERFHEKSGARVDEKCLPMSPSLRRKVLEIQLAMQVGEDEDEGEAEYA